MPNNLSGNVLCHFAAIVAMKKTIAYNMHTNKPVKRYDGTIVLRPRLYMTDHQRNWDLFMQPSTAI